MLEASFTWLLYNCGGSWIWQTCVPLGQFVSVRKQAPGWEGWAGFMLLYCSMVPFAWRIVWMDARGLVCWVGPHLHLKLERNGSATFILPFLWLACWVEQPSGKLCYGKLHNLKSSFSILIYNKHHCSLCTCTEATQMERALLLKIVSYWFSLRSNCQ